MATLISSLERQARVHLKELSALSTPPTPTVTPQGVAGVTAYSYKVVAGHRQGTTEAGSAGSTATGNATLSSTNFNRVTWTAVTGAEFYLIYRTVGGATTGVVAVVAASALQFDDTGIVADSTTAPTVSTAGSRFWSSQELVDLFNKGAADLWGAAIDLFQEHFLTIDVTNVSLAANAGSLTGVPADCFRVELIEPRDTSASSTSRMVLFRPADYNSPKFINARAQSAVDPLSGTVIYYAILGAGSPVAAPTIVVAPQVTSAVNLRLVYAPTLSALTAASTNPIPGEADMALIAYVVAFARAKERDDRSPDPNWLTIYGTEKNNLLTRLTPRQVQEETVVDGLFEAWW